MEKKKEDIFKAFTAKAVQRLKDKKVTKYETLYVPSIDQNIKIRNLNYPEIVECTEIDDKQDPNASDKYCIYLAVVEPDLRAVAMELKDQGEIKTYPEVVDIFEMNEITSIATEIMKLSGVIGSKKVTVVEEQKKLIDQDGDCYFLHYYIQKGFKLEYLLQLGVEEKCFYYASMLKSIEEREQLFSGGGGG